MITPLSHRRNAISREIFAIGINQRRGKMAGEKLFKYFISIIFIGNCLRWLASSMCFWFTPLVGSVQLWFCSSWNWTRKSFSQKKESFPQLTVNGCARVACALDQHRRVEQERVCYENSFSRVSRGWRSAWIGRSSVVFMFVCHIDISKAAWSLHPASELRTIVV